MVEASFPNAGTSPWLNSVGAGVSDGEGALTQAAANPAIRNKVIQKISRCVMIFILRLFPFQGFKLSLLFVGQILGDPHVYGHHQVSKLALGFQRGHTLARQSKDPARLGTFRDL